MEFKRNPSGKLNLTHSFGMSKSLEYTYIAFTGYVRSTTYVIHVNLVTSYVSVSRATHYFILPQDSSSILKANSQYFVRICL